MQTWNVVRTVTFFVLTCLMIGCDVVPQAKDAEQIDDDRSQFQAPKNIVTTSGDSQVLVQWPAYPNATSYILYWSNQSTLR